MSNRSRLKLLMTAIGLAAGLALLEGCYPAVEASERKSATFPVTGNLSLLVEAANGHVIIRGEAGLQEVRVTAILKAWGTSKADAEQQLRNIQIEMTQQGHQVRLRHIDHNEFRFGIVRSDNVSFEVSIPQQADLDITTDNGDVRVDGVQGTQKIWTDNGNLDLRVVSGRLNLETDNGDIDIMGASVSLQATTDNGNIDFSGRLIGESHSLTTDNGNIQVTLPKDSQLQIDARTDNGNIRSSLPLQIQGDLGRNHWSVILNAPTARLSIETQNGNITLSELR